ncbi:hypothetical protein [Streptomyces longisporoflavus]|uniref:Uncharacterized protein n=1 Tax=Streptomyces longisporoflavus TaxID=28044 RepID=A0ABW7R4N7_9ACTN
MSYVRPHVRRDGTPVKGHYRRQRPRAATSSRTAPRRRAARGRTPAPRPRPVSGPTTYVAPYYRADGTRVRGHRRTLSPAAAGTGAGIIFLLILLLLAL